MEKEVGVSLGFVDQKEMERTCTQVGACDPSGSAANHAAERGPLRFRFWIALIDAGGVDRAAAGVGEHIGCVGAVKDLPAECVGEGRGPLECLLNTGKSREVQSADWHALPTSTH